MFNFFGAKIFSTSLLFAFSVILLFNACKSDKSSDGSSTSVNYTGALTYEQGIANCFAKMKENRDNGIRSRLTPECLYGASIPEFKTVDLNGDTFNSNSLKGKLSVVNFWFTTCKPCIAEIPGFNNIVEKYGTDKINYIAIGKDKREDYLECLEKHPWNFRHLPFQRDLIQDDFKIIWGYPTTLLLDENAKVIYGFSGGKTDETAPQDLMNKLSPQIDLALEKM